MASENMLNRLLQRPFIDSCLTSSGHLCISNIHFNKFCIRPLACFLFLSYPFYNGSRQGKPLTHLVCMQLTLLFTVVLWFVDSRRARTVATWLMLNT